METSTPFDLNRAVGQWRANLQNLGGFRIEELDELEGHLHESISVLHTKGLPVPEAFIIATRRLGSERQLSEEFAKANPQRLWTERALWMVAGVLGAHAFSVVVGPLLATLTNCAFSSGLSGHQVSALHFLARGVVWMGGAAMAYWILCRQSSWRDRVVEAAIRSPLLIGIGLFTVLEYLRYLMSDVGRYAEPVYKLFDGHDVVPSPQTIASIDAWFFWGNLLTQLLWIAAGPLLAGYAWRKRGGPASGSAIHQVLLPGEQEAARALQSQGLSLDETSLVLGQRRCSREVVAPALAGVPDRAIWLERAVWMVTGIALSRCLGPLVLELAWIVSAASRPAAPLFQHVAGFTSVCLGPALGRNEAPEAAAALLRALSKTSGALQTGILNTLGLRRYEPALPNIQKLVGSPDPVVAHAAVAALGEIGGASAANALQAARQTASEALRGRVDATLLVCADRFLASGQPAAAARIYEGFYKSEEPKSIQIAGLRGLIAARREKALPIVLQAIQSPDERLSAAAIQFSTAIPGEAVTKALAGRLPGLPVNAQELLLAALGVRGDPAALPAVVSMLPSQDDSVRAAACRALGQLGDSSVIELLARAAATASATVQPAARAGLLELNRGDINAGLVRSLGRGDPNVQVEIMRALAGRRAAVAFNDLRKFAADPDPALRHEAIRAMGAIADERTLPALVALTGELKTTDDFVAQEEAVSAAFRRNPDPEKQTDALLAAIGNAPADAKPTLLRLLGLSATPRALTAVRAALKDEHAPVAEAAVRTLADWPDAAPADDLLNVVQTGNNSSLKIIALRGYVRMAGLGTNSGAMYARALELAQRTEDKKLVLSSLGMAEPGQALKLVEPYLQIEALRTEAALATVQIAGRLPKSEAARAKQLVKSALAATSDPEVRREAQEVINQLEPYEDHILDWVGAGPYQQKDKDAHALFDIAFPPEQPGTPGVVWTRITNGVGAWDIDLGAAMGNANHVVGYLRTRIWSPAGQEARMECGSDDGIKVWLNGVVVHANNVERGPAPRQDLVKVTLKQGWNDLLLKVTNAGGGWACACRFRQPDGSALKDLKVEAK